MKLIASIVMALFVASTFVAGLSNATDSTKTELPVAKASSFVTSTVETSASYESPNITPVDRKKTTTTTTTEKTTSTSTEVPTTTTTTTEKTTSTTTEVPTTTTPTTEKPTSTSTVAPKPTTPKPNPNDKPQKGTWKLLDKKTKETCIIVELAAQLNFTYTINDTKMNSTYYNIPVNETNVSKGRCNNGTNDETIIVTWPAKSLNQTNQFAYTFGLKEDKKTFYLKEAEYSIFAGDLFNGNNDTILLIHNSSDYATLKGYSYHCTKEKTLSLTDKFNKTVGSVHVSHVQLQAFYSSKTGNFATAVDCEASGTPDYVPMIVGISLIALVLIIVIGYAVGRRRAQANGYVSM